MKIWIGPSGYNPDLGRVNTNKPVNIPVELESKYKLFYKEKKPEAKEVKQSKNKG